MSEAATTATKPFITLECCRVGIFPLFWTGGPNFPQPSSLPYKGGSLQDFLDRIVKKLVELQPKLNKSFGQIDRTVHGKGNGPITRHFNGVAAWANAMSLEVSGYNKYYRGVPFDFLYRDFVYPLKEVSSKCFAMAHVFGGQDEAIVGLRGLLTDFILSGIAPNGCSGRGLFSTVSGHARAYFEPPHNFEPILYDRFGELNQAISAVVTARYPKEARALAANWDNITKSYFTLTDISSPSRDKMLEEMRMMIRQLQQ